MVEAVGAVPSPSVDRTLVPEERELSRKLIEVENVDLPMDARWVVEARNHAGVCRLLQQEKSKPEFLGKAVHSYSRGKDCLNSLCVELASLTGEIRPPRSKLRVSFRKYLGK